VPSRSGALRGQLLTPAPLGQRRRLVKGIWLIARGRGTAYLTTASMSSGTAQVLGACLWNARVADVETAPPDGQARITA